MITHAVILAIGHAHIHSKLTYNRSHVMLPALGKPLLVRIMERLYRIGIREYTVIVGEEEGAVASYLNTQWMPDVKINFLLRFHEDSLTQLMKQVAESIQTPFIVCSYNSFTHHNFPERLIRKHNEKPTALIFSGAPTTISQATQHTYALVEQRRIIGITNRINPAEHALVLNDLFICGTDMIDYLTSSDCNPPHPDPAYQFIDIAKRFVKVGGGGLMAESNWILQIEADRDLLTLNKMLLDEAQDAHILSELSYTVKIIPPVRIDPQVSVGQGAKIGPHVYLERGSSVGHDVVLKNSIVLSRASVPAKKTIVNTILTTRGPIN